MEIIGSSQKIKDAISLSLDLAKTDITVLITGESGTGKEIFAKFIHENGKRSKNPFIAINCGAISQSILESELFGHERGAFTGAIATRRGYFESSNKGSIFLDEVAEMPLNTQVKFLRTLESGEFQRVGSSETLHTNARIIAATNRSLEEAVAQNTFRGDLFFRLRVATIDLPPLRERSEDILLLAEKFVRDFEKKYHVKFSGFTTEATQKLLEYNYPGNIRELRNLIETLVALEHKQPVSEKKISKHFTNALSFAPTVINHSSIHFPNENLDSRGMNYIHRILGSISKDVEEIKKKIFSEGQKELYLPPSSSDDLNPIQNHIYNLAVEDSKKNVPSLARLEKIAIQEALKNTDGNKRQASLILGITERTLYRKIKEYGISLPSKKTRSKKKP